MNGDHPGVLILCPRDLIGAAPYSRAACYAGVAVQTGARVKIIEPAAQKMSLADISAAATAFSPLLVLLGVFPSTLPDSYQTIQMIRASLPNVKIIIEGYMINACPDFVHHLGADYGLTGDAEFTFSELIKAAVSGSGPDLSLEGLVWREGSAAKWNKPAYIKHLDEVPLPAYELMPIGRYYSASTNKRLFTMFTARGCPYECNFCANTSQAIYRYHSSDRVIREIELLVNKLGVEYLEFMDLTFTVNRNRVLDICHKIVQNNLVFSWACETRVDKVDEALLLEMKKAGCVKITFGVESGSEAVRSKSQKTISNREFIEVFELCSRIGIKTMANFIFGHPQETLEEMNETIAFSKQLNPFNVLFTKMIPLPDVEIFDIAVREGVITGDVWLRYMKKETDMPVYTPKGISRSMLDRIYTSAQMQFYIRPKIIFQYMPLFADLRFFFRSLMVFSSLTFGSTKYK